MGHANVSHNGVDFFVFKNFQFGSLLDQERSLKQTPFLPPVYAAFVGLAQQFTPSEDIIVSSIRSSSLMRMLGYLDRQDFEDISSGTATHDLSKPLQAGLEHMSASIQITGARATNHITASRHWSNPIRQGELTRSLPWFIITGLLLLTWATLLALGTVRMYRRTFGDSLNSYIAARLLVDMPHLVDRHCAAGALIDNPKLRTSFKRVGDGNPDENIGHITPGGEGLLDVRRMYGASLKSRIL
jgi:hypothetical protein